ncbi:MAG: HAMP domain-containing protein [Alphaproteobacteria bacterium]|nr:HAMP domain-containing protein [Alphaproteobacteria bacterium]
MASIQSGKQSKGIMISHRIISIGAVGMLVALIISGTAWWAINNLSSQLAEGNMINSALRNHLEADMMHDALRGDVLMALRAGRVGSADDKKGVRDDIKDHAETIRDRIAQNSALPLAPDLKKAIEDVGPALAGYIKSAEMLVVMGLGQSPETDSQLPSFYDAFGVLEERMEAVSDLIETVSGTTEEAGKTAASTAITAIFSSLLVALALLIIFVWVISRQISVPLKGMTEVMGALAEGLVDVDVPDTSRSDEIGAIARAVQVFKDNAIDKIRLEAQEHEAAEERQKSEEAEHQRSAKENAERQQRQERMAELTSGFGATVEEILDFVATSSTEMESSARSMVEMADQSKTESSNVATSAEEATSSVQTVSSAAEELSTSISEISRQVTHSSDISGKAVEAANNTNQTIRELAEAAQRIGDVVDLINDIAEQTNLLALNATIEAARAGDAGKGFAVVASEVKNLASQTAQATEDIGGQIGGIQQTTKEAVSAIEGIGSTIGEMNEIATAIATAVEEQGAATSEISRNVQDAASGTQEVAQSIGKVRTSSEHTGEASGNVLNASRDLAERFQTLRQEVGSFLENVKTV